MGGIAVKFLMEMSSCMTVYIYTPIYIISHTDLQVTGKQC